MRRSRKGTFPFVYFIYVCLLLVAFLVALIYVNSIIREYETTHPDFVVDNCIKIMQRDAADGTLAKKIAFPEDSSERFESADYIKSKYAELICADGIKFFCKSDDSEKGIKVYTVSQGSVDLAEIELKLQGERKTKLAIFPIAEYKVTRVTPMFEKQSYTLSVPGDFSVTVNGVALTESDGVSKVEGSVDYTVSGLYMTPEFSISDLSGNIAQYEIKGNTVYPELYNYTLTLSPTLKVELNGELHEGELLEDGRVRHDIRLLTKPTVKISDNFGNIVKYEGGNTLPLTYMTITALDTYTVKVAGSAVPTESISDVTFTEFEPVSEFVENLPTAKKYDIAILKDNIDITVTDSSGSPVEFDPSVKNLDLTTPVGLESIPAEIASEVDVLNIAEYWSLFMSNDYPFNSLEQFLIPGSFQYEAAKKYNSSIDKTFMSAHDLLDPPFRDEAVTNYVKISENSFYVDISFGKYMSIPGVGEQIDKMNHRFYFVKYADPEGSSSNAEWKLVGMKEVVNNGE